MAISEQIEAMRGVLRSKRCACGRAKSLRKAFCAADDRALGDAAIRAERYKIRGDVDAAMVAAYLACGAWLFEQGYCDREVKL